MTSDVLAKLRDIVGAAHVHTAQEAVTPYAQDWRGRYKGTPLAVVRPANTEETAAIVAACHLARLPVVPQGGNTGLCGGATPIGGEVIVQMGRMARIRELDTANDTLTAEAGCALHEVREAAASADRLFPLELGSQGSCQIGGNLATNAGGVHVLRFGTMRELVLGLEVVLPNGEIWEGLRGLRKDNTGYDLTQLFVGAEGTLGIITAAVLKLYPAQRSKAVAWIGTDSVENALRILTRVRGRAHQLLNSFEIVGRQALELVLKHMPGAQDPLPDAHAWYVLVEVADSDPDAPLGGLLEALLQEGLEAGELQDATLASSLAQDHALWALRENISEAQRVEGFSIKHDVAVPVSRLARFMALADAEMGRRWPGVRIVAFGHAGDGNVHYNLSMAEDGSNADLLAQSERINQVIHDLVHLLGGSISAEHGLGQLKRDEILRYKSPVEMRVMRQIKAALDPLGLMNPGKVL